MCLVAGLSLVLVATTFAGDGGRPFTTELTGEAEVNAAGVPNQGDLDGTGTASLTFNPGLEQVCFELSVEDITLPATAAHIHGGPVTAPGPIVVPLTAPDATGESSGCVSADRTLILSIMRNPQDYYVNVHNTDFPPGALRGQLGT
jgi:hypothetical protein